MLDVVACLLLSVVVVVVVVVSVRCQVKWRLLFVVASLLTRKFPHKTLLANLFSCVVLT